MILTGMLVYLPPTTRVAAAMIVCLASIVLLNLYQPHTDRTVFWVVEGSYLLTMIKFVTTTYRGIYGSVSEHESLVLGWFLIGLDIFMYATAAVCMLFLFVKAKEAASTNTATEGALAAERSMPKRRISLTSIQVQKAVSHYKAIDVSKRAEAARTAHVASVSIRRANAAVRLRQRLHARRTKLQVKENSLSSGCQTNANIETGLG